MVRRVELCGVGHVDEGEGGVGRRERGACLGGMCGTGRRVGLAVSGRRRRRAFSSMVAKRGSRVIVREEGSTEMKGATSEGRGVGGVGGEDGVGGFAIAARTARRTKA